MQLGRSGEVRALAAPEIPQMQEARNFWRMRVEQAVVSACSLSACAFVLSLNPWNRGGRVLCSAESGRNAPALAGGPRILAEAPGVGPEQAQRRAGFPLLRSGSAQHRCRWQPCLPSSSFPASSQPPNKGLRRCVRSSSLFNSSNCHVEEREGGRLLLSARLSQSKIPAEQLKIDGQLVVRAGSSPESMASVSQECCLVIRPDKLGLGLVCVCVRDRLQWGRGAALAVSEAGVLVSSGVCRESITR